MKKIKQFKNIVDPLKNNQGLSLIEILIALTILGIAGTFITGKIFDQLHEGKVRSADIQMQNLAARLKEFRRHCNRYPTTEQGLDALVSKPSSGPECKRYNPGGYIDGGKVPLDPWDNDFDYVSDGDDFDIISFGESGEKGGTGRNKDIHYKKENESQGE